MIFNVFGFIITIAIYWGAKRIYRSSNNKALLSPLFITPLFLIILLLWSNTPYESYNTSAKYISYALQPATIALAVPLYKYFDLFKKNALPIVLSVLFGTGVALSSSELFAHLFHLDSEMIGSLIPHSVTTPMAMDISQVIGGIPAITAVFVIITGIIGSLIGPTIIKHLKINNCIARGILLGTSAHASGTTKAFEFGTTSGTISSVSMILTGFITIFAAPIMVNLLH
ncbi:LrgB family protein [Desulfitobacterium sp.]|uniref:LrgB family protein n=1 Tax=Desulfitobacterium sp. TaxID=49981 RepID=UPI002B20363D|nr:LrgB family protein [Desulfitobacterium sp.]MEA4900932.1 LrgB family protein [Desulfitobacterium sp.]